MLSIEEALKKEGRVSRLSWEEVAYFSIFMDHFTSGQVVEGEEVSEDSDGTTVSGKFAIGSQLHFHLETHSTICRYQPHRRSPVYPLQAQ